MRTLCCPPHRAARDLIRAARVVRPPRSLHWGPASFLEARARERPGEVAYVRGDRRLTWAELAEAVRGGDPDLPALGGPLRVRTSGTTGPARVLALRLGAGAALQLGGLLGRLPLARVRRVACLAPLDRAHGLGTFVAATAVGAVFHDVTRLDPAEAAARLAEAPPDLLTGVPVHLERLVGQAPRSLRVPRVVSGSDMLAPDTVAALVDKLGARVWNSYGTTETGSLTLATPDDLARHPRTVGRPLPGVRLTPRPDGLLEAWSPLAGRAYALDRGRVVDGLVFLEGRAP